MPRRKKRPHEMTTDEAMKHLFPAPVVRHARKLAHSDEEANPQVKGSKPSIKKDRT